MDSTTNRIKEDHKIIEFVLNKCAHDIALNIKYYPLKGDLIPIFTDIELENAEGGENSRPNRDIMVKICDYARSKSMEKFLEFVYAIKEDHEHVFSYINKAYRENTGQDLPQISKKESNIVEDHKIIEFVLKKSTYHIASNVKYYSLRAGLKTIFTDTELERAEGGDHNRANYDIMVKICDSARCKSMEKFLEFVYVIKKDSKDVFSNINKAYRENTGQDLPQISKKEAPAAASAICPATSIAETTKSSAHPVAPLLQSQQNIPEQMKPNKPEIMVQNKPNKVYKMDTDPRGCCLIINNEKFDHLPSRDGSTEDCKKIIALFKQLLGFQIFLYENKKAYEMMKILLEFGASYAFHKVSAVVILSHIGNNNDGLYGTDGNVTKNGPEINTFIPLLELQTIVQGNNCPAMNGKSELFNLKAFKGDFEDKYNIRGGFNQTASAQSVGVSISDSDGLTVPDAAPVDLSFLDCKKSCRSTQTGSFFVAVFTPKEGKYAHEMSCDEIVTEVVKTISK